MKAKQYLSENLPGVYPVDQQLWLAVSGFAGLTVGLLIGIMFKSPGTASKILKNVFEKMLATFQNFKNDNLGSI